MVKVFLDKKFRVLLSKIQDNVLKQKIGKQIRTIRKNPRIGKPMRYARKGTRELPIKPFRLSYVYNAKEDKVYILDLYHIRHR